MNGLRVRAAGAGRQYAPAALGRRFWAPLNFTVRPLSWLTATIGATMRLDATAAIVASEKLRDYLLSSAHPIGRYKSTFFRSLGYSQDQWDVLERDLRAILANEAQPAGATEYGQKFTVRGTLAGPSGRVAGVVTVWIILRGETAPRFVTAYPQV